MYDIRSFCPDNKYNKASLESSRAKTFIPTTPPLLHMASHANNIKIHEHCKVAPPPPSATQTTSIPLTFFDTFWLRFHPVERVFFYTLPNPQSHPSFFFNKLVPNLKASLSLTLQHFLPLAGNIVWPSESQKPIVQYTPGDGVSFLIAESDEDFNNLLKNSPHEASVSRSFVPHLESTDSFTSVISLQITFFPNSGFSIGISTHHAVLDGKSSTMFIKAWAFLCKTKTTNETEESSPTLLPELEPLFNREIIKDPNDLGTTFTKNWTEILSTMFPNEKGNERSLKILPLEPKLEDSVRATFELSRGDLEKINKMVLFKWNTVEGAQEQEPIIDSLKPKTLSTFVLTCAYVSVCLAKAIQEAESDDDKKHKFVFGFTVDCRARLEPPIPQNYFGNCVCNHIVDTEPEDFTKEEGVVIVAKKIYGKIKKMDKGALDGVETLMFRYMAMVSEGVEIMGVSGSNRFGVYGVDFGWGRPAKVEITSVGRGLTIDLAESKDGRGGVEVGLVLKKHVMDLFTTLFREGLCIDD